MEQTFHKKNEALQDNALWIVIQGPLDYYDQIKPFYSNFKNVIWSTWESEKEQVQNEDHYILNSPPLISGYANINYQIKSTLEGLKKAKELGAKYALKMRSDMVFSDLELLISKLKFDNTLYFPSYFFKKVDSTEYGYLVDYFQFGPIDKMIKLWSIPIKHRTSYPEKYITEHLFKKMPDEKLRYIAPLLIENSINCDWFKRKMNFTEVCQREPYYLFNKFLK